MAHNLDEQTQQYQQRFQEFLADIDDGTFEGNLDMMVNGFGEIPPQIQKQINEQIQTYRQSSPSQSVPGFINFIGRTTANSFLGPVGLSFQDFQNPQRLVDKAKKTALQSVGHAIARNVPNPTTQILKRLRGRGRDSRDDVSMQESYQGRVDDRRKLSDPKYKPLSYEDDMKSKYPEETRRIGIIQNNTGRNFYSTYKVLHDSNSDSEITSGLSNHLIKFHITNDDKILIFRMANFNGFTDAITVNYNDVRYFGRPEALKQYDSVARNVSFAFDVVVDNQIDIDPIYKKLDILAGICYPNSYTVDNIIQPNIIELSIGSYFERVPFFISNVTYTGDDELTFAEGKPRLITVSITGDVIQRESNPQISLDTNRITNRFINQIPSTPARLEGEGNPETFDNQLPNNFT